MEEVVRGLSVLSEPVRVRLLAVLHTAELGVGDLTRVLQLPQSTVSRHLKALRVAGWITRRAEGNAALYGASPEAVAPVVRQLWEIVGPAFAATPQAAEDQSRLEATLAARDDADSFFGRIHAEWDTLRQELFGDAFLLPALVALLPSDFVVADLGCGTGPALAALAPAVGHVIGIDREPRMLAAAADRVSGMPNVELRQGSLANPPLADGEIDAATCVLVLHHVADLQGAFAGIGRALRPGGRLVVVDMIAHDRRSWLRSMGHQHLGFSAEDLTIHARHGALRMVRHQALPPVTEAQGPPLFVAVLEREGR